MQRTRREILDILKRNGRATLEELARGVKLVPVTVRAHLNVLERDGLVDYEEVRGRVGRPYYVYSLTEDAEALFPKSYHQWANRVLSSLEQVADPELIAKVIDNMAEVWAAERAPRLRGKDLPARVAEVAVIRTEEGALAEVEQVPDGMAIVQYNCPSARVASSHSEFTCGAELAYLRRLLGEGVQRVEWSQSGARACRYFIPIATIEEPIDQPVASARTV